MPTAPNLPIERQGQSGVVDPKNFLLAAADLHQSGELSAPVPTGKDLQTGKTHRHQKIKIIK